MSALSNLTLGMPDEVIKLECLFINEREFYSSLEIDYFGSISNFPNYKSLNLPTHAISILREKTEDKLESLLEIRKSMQIICSSREDNHQSLLVIIQAKNNFFSLPSQNFNYILLKFSLVELFGEELNNHVAHIENIRFSISQLHIKSSEIQQKIQNTEKELEKLTQDGNKIHSQNSIKSSQLNDIKRKIVDMHKKFTDLDEEENKIAPSIRCTVCSNNLKSVLYIPCGHSIVCNACLAVICKETSRKSRKQVLRCQFCQEKVVDTKEIVLG